MYTPALGTVRVHYPEPRLSQKVWGIGSAFCSSVAQTERSAAVLLILTKKSILFARPNLSAVVFRIQWQPLSISHSRRTPVARMCFCRGRWPARAVAEHREPDSSSWETMCVSIDGLNVTLFKSTLVVGMTLTLLKSTLAEKVSGRISTFATPGQDRKELL
jgi:hypothetical protein